MIEIVLLEKDTLTSGDMDFSCFEKIGKVKYYDRLKESKGFEGQTVASFYP